MKTPQRLLAEKLLHLSAINLQPDNPFTWASGWSSPIYTDNRKVLSYPDVRNFLKIELCRLVVEKFPEADAVVAIESGAVAMGAIIADTLSLPYAFVRSEPKDHGLENLIEGNLRPGSKVVLVDGVISTGTSAVKALDALYNSACEVLGMVAVFSYDFPITIKRLRDANVTLYTASNFPTLLEVAQEIGYISEADTRVLEAWRVDPANWTPEISAE
ncbi:MAG: orotate phosphoribosyltransferase [Bacteroidales bacterium]|nr:orotate phosphoribosyltransferase [Bacteroidales bacterium]MBD5284350.1 orotate phosphoribosyltransferase [Bacteroides sp.]